MIKMSDYLTCGRDAAMLQPLAYLQVSRPVIIIIIIIIKNKKIRVTLCVNAAVALYIVNKMCVYG